MNETRDATSPRHLRVLCMDLDTRDRPIAILRKDSPLCRSEGFTAHARIRLESARGEVIVELFQTGSELLDADQIGLSTAAWEKLQVRDGDELHASHPRPLESVHHVRGKSTVDRSRPRRCTPSCATSSGA